MRWATEHTDGNRTSSKRPLYCENRSAARWAEQHAPWRAHGGARRLAQGNHQRKERGACSDAAHKLESTRCRKTSHLVRRIWCVTSTVRRRARARWQRAHQEHRARARVRCGGAAVVRAMEHSSLPRDEGFERSPEVDARRNRAAAALRAMQADQ